MALGSAAPDVSNTVPEMALDVPLCPNRRQQFTVADKGQ
jgi:hypothetical protein